MNPTVMAQRGLWQSTNFTLLFSSRVIKVIADNFASIAFVWLLLESGGDAISTFILYVCNIVPLMLFGLLVSPFLSRGRLTYWMFASDVVRALIIVLIPVLYIFNNLPIWLFFAVGFIQSVCGSVYNPAAVALLPKIVEKSKIQQANAFISSSDNIVYLLGLMGAGALVTILSSSITLMITSVLFLLSALLILIVRPRMESNVQGRVSDPVNHSSATGPFEKATAEPYWHRIREGFITVRKHKLLFSLNIYAIFLNVGITPWLVLITVFVYQDMQGSAAILTLIRGSGVVGAFIMGLMLSKMEIKRHGTLFIFAGIAEGVALIVLGVTPGLGLIIVCSFIMGMSETAINVPEKVIIQTTIPEQQQAQVYAVVTTLSTLLLPIAGLIVGPLALMLGTGWVITIGGILITLSGIATYLLTPLAKIPSENEMGSVDALIEKNTPPL
jgi:DHA3 family macrolide efflux protein-like MFS transporter